MQLNDERELWMINSKYMYSNEYTRQFLEFASKDYKNREKLAAVFVDRGLVLPLKKSAPGGPLMGYGGVLDKEDNYVEESAQIGKGDTLPRFTGKYDYDKESVQNFDETVIYIGAFPEHWGHFLVDMVYRFWYFLESKERRRIVYCSEGPEISGVFLEFFRLLGIDGERLYRIEKPSRFKQVIIPKSGYMACDYYTEEYRSVFRKIVDNLPELSIMPYDKIYLSRGHFKEAQGKEVGEKNIEYNFRQNGFQVIYMEELSLTEQAYYISHAKVVAALSGTLCHNILFAGKDTELVILNKTHIINTHQVLIDQMMGITVTYVDIYKEPYKRFPVSYGGGPFLLDSRRLMEYFRDKGMGFYPERKSVVFLNRLLYTKMCLGIRLYKLYEKTYYKVCEYEWLIGMLRKMKVLIEGIE